MPMPSPELIAQITIIGVVFFALQRFFVRGLLAGATKG